MKRRTACITIAALGTALAACASEKVKRDSTPGVVVGTAGAAGGPAGGIAASGGSSAIPQPADGSCPAGLPGPELVRLTTPKGVSYCMDATEVTQSHFALFVTAVAEDAKAAHPGGEPPRCTAPYPLVPEGPDFGADNSLPCPASRYDPEKHGDAPVVCIEGCAARAYCLWAGKELCGKVTGGPLDAYSDTAQLETSAWYNACTNGGRTDVASPGSVERGACRVQRSSSESTPVEEGVGCVGTVAPYDKVRNLGGNVQEFEAYGDNGGVIVRGSEAQSADGGKVNEACTFFGGGSKSDYSGFRCCKPLPR